MKRKVILLGLALLGLLAVYRASPYCMAALQAANRKAMYARMRAGNTDPLVLDAVTQAILAGADRVETFRLVDPNADDDEKEIPVKSWPHGLLFDQCQVMQVGPAQNRTVAAAPRSALSELPAPKGADGQFTLEQVDPNGFGADVGFRVWKGKSHVDVCIGLYSNFAEIMTYDARGKFLGQTTVILGGSQPAFLVLSKQAFPTDSALAYVK